MISNEAQVECPFLGLVGARRPVFESGGICRAGRNFNAIDGCCNSAMKNALLFSSAELVAEAVKSLRTCTQERPHFRLIAATTAFRVADTERGTGSAEDLRLEPIRDAFAAKNN